MRALSVQESEAVNGGFSVFGITEIGTGLKLMGQINAVTSTGLKVFAAGYALGSAISHGYEWAMGDSIGGDWYDLWNC